MESVHHLSRFLCLVGKNVRKVNRLIVNVNRLSFVGSCHLVKSFWGQIVLFVSVDIVEHCRYRISNHCSPNDLRSGLLLIIIGLKTV